ncbi:MAG: dihydroneopterin aldolase [Planctomycetota bacterium]
MAPEVHSAPSGSGATHAPMHDVIHIRNLRAWTLIGVHAHERDARQELRMDVWLRTDIRPSAGTDAIGDTIDYSTLARAIREHAGRSSHQLVETLAEEVAAICIDDFGAAGVRLTIEKPGAVSGTDAVGVTIDRGRPEAGGGNSTSEGGGPA